MISCVGTPFPKLDEFNESDVERLRKIVITLHKPSPILLYVVGLSHVCKHAGHVLILKRPKGKVLTMAEFLHLPNFRCYKVAAGTLMPLGVARVTHLTPPANRLEDIPPKTGDMETVEISYRKVLVKKEKKKKKVEAKAATKADDDAQVERVTGKRRVGEEGTSCKKKKTRQETPTINLDSEHVSLPTPINHSKPLETLVNEMYISETASPSRLDALRNQTDEQGCDVVNENVDEHMVDGGDNNEHGDADLANEGHGDNAEGLSGLRTQPSPANQSSYSARRFGDLPFTPQRGLTDSSRMDNSRDCRDMLANLFTPAHNEFLNYGLPDRSAIKRSWRLFCQSTQQQANVLLHFEALSEEHTNLAYAHESSYDENVSAYNQLLKDYDGALNIKKGLNKRDEELEGEKKGLEEVNAKEVDRIKQLKEELKKSEEGTHQLRVDREKLVVKCGNREMVRQWIVIEYLPTFFRRLHQSTEYKRALGEFFSLAIRKGFIDGISMVAFMEQYEKLFDNRYPYVNKVTSTYLLDLSGLQNIMPDETGPTPGQGPRATPTTSYA
ncbi:hypothetical protein Tco_1201806 [Tanacetum coccineum]